jgi:hypothetical protein
MSHIFARDPSTTKKVIGEPQMHVEWAKIPMFPNYSVSSEGVVRNEDTDREMVVHRNQRGIAYVSLTKNKVQYKRSLAILVAEAFLSRPSFAFDTPINLNGDRLDCTADNLMWRPRWFATKYFQQFMYGSVGSIQLPVQIVETEEIFEGGSFHAATTLGLLDREIAISAMTKNYVWPINKHFRVLK